MGGAAREREKGERGSGSRSVPFPPAPRPLRRAAAPSAVQIPPVELQAYPSPRASSRPAGAPMPPALRSVPSTPRRGGGGDHPFGCTGELNAIRKQIAFSAVLCTQGRVVGLCWEHWKPKGPKGQDASSRTPLQHPLYRAVEPSSGSNVIPRRARPGLAGLRPQILCPFLPVRGTSPLIERPPLGPYRRPMPRVLGGS